MGYKRASPSSPCSSAPETDVIMGVTVQDRCYEEDAGWHGKSRMIYCNNSFLYNRWYESANCGGTPKPGSEPSFEYSHEYEGADGCKWGFSADACVEDDVTSHAETQYPVRSRVWVIFFGLAA